VAGTAVEDMHRLGGSRVDNPRLKPREATLKSARYFPLARSFAWGGRTSDTGGVPAAEGLHAAAQVIGSTTADKIRGVGFDVMPNPAKKLPNHYRLIHPDGVAGFSDENLARLSAVFTETSGHGS
jgi:hypothetical protein